MLALAHLHAHSSGTDLEKIKGVPGLLEFQAQKRILKVEHQQRVPATERTYKHDNLLPAGTPSFHAQGELDTHQCSNETHPYIPIKDWLLWNNPDKDSSDVQNTGLRNFIETQTALSNLFELNGWWYVVHS